MPDLEKLDDVILNLTNSSENISRISNLISASEQTSDNIKNSLNEIVNCYKQLSLIEKSQKDVHDKSDDIIMKLNDFMISSKEENAKFKSETNRLLHEIKNENSEMYRDFEKKIKSDFERIKSDFTVDLRKTSDENRVYLEKRISEEFYILNDDLKKIHKRQSVLMTINLVTVISIIFLLIIRLIG